MKDIVLVDKQRLRGNWGKETRAKRTQGKAQELR